MKRLFFISAVALATACGQQPQTSASSPDSQDSAPANSADQTRTQWRIISSEGLDALLLIGVIGGDVMAAPIYEIEVAQFRDRLAAEEIARIESIGAKVRDNGGLTGPLLALIGSAGRHATLDDVISTFESPETLLRETYQASPYWSDESWNWFIANLSGDVNAALRALGEAEFPEWRNAMYGTQLDDAVARVSTVTQGVDLVPEQSRLLGRELDPSIEIVLVAFSKPYGIKIIGQRFLNHFSYDPELHLRTAAHEMFHPPLDFDNRALQTRLDLLREDPWIMSIVDNHDPRFGYNSFTGVVDEGAAQALEQIASERLQLAFTRDPAERWANHDGGMHMLAAAFYHAMNEDGFAEAGGVFEDWLISAIDRRVLAPDEIRRRAAEIVGQNAVDKWNPDNFRDDEITDQ